MTDEFINKVTLDCLLNKELYYKYNNVTKNNKKDKKFYKKRIYNLTRDLLVNKEQDLCFPVDVNYAFDNYVNTCIAYFKNLDKTDILQDDYKDIRDTITIPSVINEETLENADKLLMRSIQLTSLDSFVTKKVSKKKEIILPQQKEINLKDPILKTKGIQKKNITNKYDEIKDTKVQIANRETKKQEV